jgi:hypothetical protein
MVVKKIWKDNIRLPIDSHKIIHIESYQSQKKKDI